MLPIFSNTFAWEHPIVSNTAVYYVLVETPRTNFGLYFIPLPVVATYFAYVNFCRKSDENNGDLSENTPLLG